MASSGEQGRQSTDISDGTYWLGPGASFNHEHSADEEAHPSDVERYVGKDDR